MLLTFLLHHLEQMPKAGQMSKNRLSSHSIAICCFNERMNSHTCAHAGPKETHKHATTQTTQGLTSCEVDN